MNLNQKIAVAIVDMLVLVELCISMYAAARNPDMVTPVFVKSFFAMALPTLVMAKVAVKKLQTAEARVG
jgi:hypothetical protein